MHESSISDAKMAVNEYHRILDNFHFHMGEYVDKEYGMEREDWVEQFGEEELREWYSAHRDRAEDLLSDLKTHADLVPYVEDDIESYLDQADPQNETYQEAARVSRKIEDYKDRHEKALVRYVAAMEEIEPVDRKQDVVYDFLSDSLRLVMEEENVWDEVGGFDEFLLSNDIFGDIGPGIEDLEDFLLSNDLYEKYSYLLPSNI